AGVYIAKPVGEDPEDGRASHIIFVVRADGGGSDLLYQTSDLTWQAYNTYGGNSLYFGSPVGRAYKVSYNRPFTTRCCAFPNGSDGTWVFDSEDPLIPWLRGHWDHVETPGRGGTQRQRGEPAAAQGVHAGRPRRVSVGQRARERGGGPGCGRAHRHLQR